MPSATKENEGCCKHAVFTVNIELEQCSGRLNASQIRHLRSGCGILEGVVELCSAQAQLCEQGRSALLWGVVQLLPQTKPPLWLFRAGWPTGNKAGVSLAPRRTWVPQQSHSNDRCGRCPSPLAGVGLALSWKPSPLGWKGN